MKKVALIGVGVIGKERLKGIQLLQNTGRKIDLVGIYDPLNSDVKKIAEEYKTKSFFNLSEILETDLDWVFVATPHDVIIDLLPQILKRGHKILVEKPLGRSVAEAKKLIDFTIYPDQLWVGFNYRFFDGISTAICDLKQEKFGSLISLSFILGHGGNPEMRESWKLDPIRAGGGCLIDPGIHLLDLCRLILNGSPKVSSGLSWHRFWNTGIEEECHLLLEKDETVISLQISIVRWRSTFTMQINGTDGYGIVSGRNRSYGNQTYVRGKRWGWLSGKSQKESEELVLETNGNDVFAKEIDALLFPSEKLLLKPCSAQEALLNMNLLEDCLKTLNIEKEVSKKH